MVALLVVAVTALPRLGAAPLIAFRRSSPPRPFARCIRRQVAGHDGRARDGSPFGPPTQGLLHSGVGGPPLEGVSVFLIPRHCGGGCSEAIRPLSSPCSASAVLFGLLLIVFGPAPCQCRAARAGHRTAHAQGQRGAPLGVFGRPRRFCRWPRAASSASHWRRRYAHLGAYLRHALAPYAMSVGLRRTAHMLPRSRRLGSQPLSCGPVAGPPLRRRDRAQVERRLTPSLKLTAKLDDKA